MIKRIQKRSKPVQTEVDYLSGDSDSGLVDPSRNVLAALDKRISDLERLNRRSKKRKNAGNENICTSHRPTSVPSKTVSFSPYIRHGEGDDIPPERHAKWKSKCRYCNLRGRRSTLTTSPSRPGLAADRAHFSDREASCVSPNSFSDSPEFYRDVSLSPGPARFYRDFSGSAGDHTHSWLSNTAGSLQSAERDRSSSSIYYQKPPGWRYARSCDSKVSYTSSDVSRSRSDELLRNRASRLSHCLVNEDVSAHDSKIDRLLAKYSDYSYPKQHSPPMNYFPYKSSFLETLMLWGSNNNRSNLSKLELLNASLTTRKQRIVRNHFFTCSLPSSYTALIDTYKDIKERRSHAYNKSRNCAKVTDVYQSRDSNTVHSDPLPESQRYKVYRNEALMMPTHVYGKSDSEVKAQFDRFIKPWFDKQPVTFQSKYSSLFLGRPLGLSAILSKKPVNVVDDIRLQDKFQGIILKASMPSRPSRQSCKPSSGVHYDSLENPQPYLPGQAGYRRSSSTFTPHFTTQADSVFNYNLNSSRSVGADQVPQSNHPTHDISKKISSTINASRASFGSSAHSLDSIFSASTKHCATNAGYVSLLQFEKSFLDKCLHPVKSQTDMSSAKWNGADTDVSSAKWNGTDTDVSSAKWNRADTDVSSAKWNLADIDVSSAKWNRADIDVANVTFSSKSRMI